MRTDYSYIGSGRILARKRGDAAPFREIGNCSALTIGVEQETKRLRDFRSPGGGTYNQVDRITGVTLAVTAHDLSPENLALALYGTTEAVAAGTNTDEPQVAYEGGYVVLLDQAASITEVTDPTGVTTYTAGTDYIFQHGGLFIPTTTTIPAPVDTVTANILVTYPTKKGDLIQALTNSAEELELVFLGLNEADSGSEATVKCWRAKFGPTQGLPLISDDYAALEMTGAVLADGSKTGGTSQYFQAFIEDNTA
jgi:hypothetical protein